MLSAWLELSLVHLVQEHREAKLWRWSGLAVLGRRLRRVVEEVLSVLTADLEVVLSDGRADPMI